MVLKFARHKGIIFIKKQDPWNTLERPVHYHAQGHTKQRNPLCGNMLSKVRELDREG